MYRAYTYYDQYHPPSGDGMDIFIVVIVLALIIVAIIWVLGGFDDPAFPSKSLGSKVDGVFQAELGKIALDPNPDAAKYVDAAREAVLKELKKANAIT